MTRPSPAARAAGWMTRCSSLDGLHGPPRAVVKTRSAGPTEGVTRR